MMLAHHDSPLLAFADLAVTLSSLTHDNGKGGRGFQSNLKISVDGGAKPSKDPLRHEYISVLLLDCDDPQAMVDALSQGRVTQWFEDRCSHLRSTALQDTLIASLRAIATKTSEDGERQDAAMTDLFDRTLSINSKEKWQHHPFWMSVLWLVFTHHKLLAGRWNEHLNAFTLSPERHMHASTDDSLALEGQIKAFLDMLDKGQPWHDDHWCAAVQEAFQALKLLRTRHPDFESTMFRPTEDGPAGFAQSTPWIKTLTRTARLSLVLGDQEASSRKEITTDPAPDGLYANTIELEDRRVYGDTLTTHLIKTAYWSRKIVRSIFAHRSPEFFRPGRLSVSQAPAALKRMTGDSHSPFVWQDYAQLAMSRHRDQDCGLFAVVASGTGRGKTRACAAMMANSRVDSRFMTLLSMRSLTSQTAKAYLDDNIGYHPNQVAMFVGDNLLRRRFKEVQQDKRAEIRKAGPSDERYCVLYTGPIEDAVQLKCMQEDIFMMRALSAPVSVMTVDHVIRAISLGKSTDVLQLLNLMTTDLILDEIDDYKGQDLVSIGRLIELAGQFGRKVIIASATLPKPIVEGFHQAYMEGYRVYQAAYGACDAQTLVVTHTAPYVSSPVDGESFIDCYERVMFSFCASESKSANESPRRSCKDATQVLAKWSALSAKLSQTDALFPFLQNVGRIRPQAFSPASKDLARRYFFEGTTVCAVESHRANALESDGIRYSAGAIRFNSVVSAQAFMRWVQTSNVGQAYERLGVCFRYICYHAQNIGLARLEQETFLDNHLRRGQMNRGEPDPLLENSDFQAVMEQAKDKKLKDVILVIVTTSIFETGRDYDLDWAVLEPCSTTSAVQFGGRIRRHRSQAHSALNLLIMPCSIEAMTNPHGAWRDLKHTPYTPKAAPTRFEKKALEHLGITVRGSLAQQPTASSEAFSRNLIDGSPLHAGHCLLMPGSYGEAPLTAMERVYQLSLFNKAHASLDGYAYTLQYALGHADASLCNAFYTANPFRNAGEIITLEYRPDSGWISQNEQGDVRSVHELITSEMGGDHPEDLYLLKQLSFSGYEQMVTRSREIGLALGYTQEDLELATSALLSTQRNKEGEVLTFHPQLGFSLSEA